MRSHLSSRLLRVAHGGGGGGAGPTACRSSQQVAGLPVRRVTSGHSNAAPFAIQRRLPLPFCGAARGRSTGSSPRLWRTMGGVGALLLFASFDADHSSSPSRCFALALTSPFITRGDISECRPPSVTPCPCTASTLTSKCLPSPSLPAHHLCSDFPNRQRPQRHLRHPQAPRPPEP